MYSLDNKILTLNNKPFYGYGIMPPITMIFTASTTYDLPAGYSNMRYIIVAAGGGVVYGTTYGIGGGGGGGVLSGNTANPIAGSYSVVVGTGVAGNNGNNSSFYGLTAIGGGRGGYGGAGGYAGGSGGGAGGGGTAGGAGTAGQGFKGGDNGGGYRGGGGGGAAEAGYNGTVKHDGKYGDGGDGIYSDISGINTYYANGGIGAGGSGGAINYTIGGGANGVRYGAARAGNNGIIIIQLT